jgi:hypothetical protein
VDVITDEAAIREAIIASVYETFGEGAVASVNVQFLSDDEPIGDIVDVRIILKEDAPRDLVAKFGLKLRLSFAKLETDRFPVVSFIAKSEFERRQR